MKLNRAFGKKENPKTPVSDILKKLREENRKAAVNARIAISNVTESGEKGIAALLDAVKENSFVGKQ